MNINAGKYIDFQTDRFQHINTNGGFAYSPNGLLHYIYCRSVGNDHCVICRVLSSDDGFTWSKPEILHIRDDENSFISSTSLITLKNGRMLLFYSAFTNSNNMLVKMTYSDDNGYTWSLPVTCTPNHGYYIVGNDRAVLTSTGRLLLPVCCHGLIEHTNVGSYFGNLDAIMTPYGTSTILYSDDDGMSWHAGTNSISINEPVSSSGLQEPGIVEFRSGLLMGYARTDLGRQYEFYSFDNGMSWSPAEPSVFTSSCSAMTIKRREWDNLLIAVWNPIPNYISQDMDIITGRQRLVYAVSRDDGNHWSEPILIEDDPACEFSHPALFFTANHCILSYNFSLVKHSRSFRLRIRTMDVL